LKVCVDNNKQEWLSYIKPECKRILETDKIIRISESVFCNFLN